MFYLQSKPPPLNDICNEILEATWVHILVCSSIVKYAKKITINAYLIVMGIKR
jgi:hypothetical protein